MKRVFPLEVDPAQVFKVGNVVGLLAQVPIAFTTRGTKVVSISPFAEETLNGKEEHIAHIRKIALGRLSKDKHLPNVHSNFDVHILDPVTGETVLVNGWAYYASYRDLLQFAEINKKDLDKNSSPPHN